MIINDLILRIINTFNFVHCTQVLVRGFYIKRVVYIVSIDALGKYYIKGRTSLRGPYLHMVGFPIGQLVGFPNMGF